jgi:hypothetical protein
MRKQGNMNNAAIQTFLDNNCFIFHSDYGKKGVALTTAQRLKNQITNPEQVKEFQNINLYTGKENIADVDLDCVEGLEMADDFLPPAAIEFGRESTPRSHRLYKILDMNKKHTRTAFIFRSSDEDTTLVEFRGHNHYTMCGGMYDENEKVVYTKLGKLTETTYDQLHKSVAMLSCACAIKRKYAPDGLRNDYIKLIVAVLFQYKISKEDCYKIIAAASKHDEESSIRLKRIENVYKKDSDEHIQGLPTLEKDFTWSANEVVDFKKILYAITGRHTLPAYTNDFVNRIAYMMKQKKYYDLEDKEMYDGESIDVKYAKHFKNGKYTPLKFWKQHPDSKVCVDFTYKPMEQKRFVNVNKKLMINIYEENDLKPDPNADTDYWDALVKHVIPHENERNHFLDWIAYIIQNKGKKIRHGLILQSDSFQLGKGSLYDVVRDILGRVNAKKVELDQALDKGKGYLVNSIVCLIDEAKSSGKWEEKQRLINTLKTILTEGSVGIRQLYKEYTEQDTCTNYWINTNHKDAFALPPNEVRYWVYFSEAKRNETLLKDYHDARYNYNLAGGVYAKLLDRPLKHFDPLGVAPHTDFRDQMTQLADKPINDYVKECFEQGIFPLDRALVTTTELFHFWRDKSRIRITRERDVAEALKLIGGVRKRGCAVTDIGSSVNIWIIRDHDKYGKMSAIDLGNKYQGFYTDSRTSIAKAKKPQDKASPWIQPKDEYLQNMTKEGEKDVEKNKMEKTQKMTINEDDSESVGGAEDGIHW